MGLSVNMRIWKGSESEKNQLKFYKIFYCHQEYFVVIRVNTPPPLKKRTKEISGLKIKVDRIFFSKDCSH